MGGSICSGSSKIFTSVARRNQQREKRRVRAEVIWVISTWSSKEDFLSEVEAWIMQICIRRTTSKCLLIKRGMKTGTVGQACAYLFQMEFLVI